MPYGAFINALPPAFFLAVHLIGFLVGAFLLTARSKALQSSWAGDSVCTRSPSSCI